MKLYVIFLIVIGLYVNFTHTMDAGKKVPSGPRVLRDSVELYRQPSQAAIVSLNSADHISTQQQIDEQKKKERQAKREENISLMEAFRRGVFFAKDDNNLKFPHYSTASTFYLISPSRADKRLQKLIDHEQKKDKQEYKKNLESIITWIEEHKNTYEQLPVLVTAMPESYKKRLEVRLVIDFKKSAEVDDEVGKARQAIFKAFKEGSAHDIVKAYQEPFHSEKKPVCRLQDEVQFRLAQLVVFEQQNS